MWLCTWMHQWHPLIVPTEMTSHDVPEGGGGGGHHL
jgi:hypothetical protein